MLEVFPQRAIQLAPLSGYSAVFTVHHAFLWPYTNDTVIASSKYRLQNITIHGTEVLNTSVGFNSRLFRSLGRRDPVLLLLDGAILLV
jgi:hypothetical protein